MAAQQHHGHMVIDASVLIDYRDSDRTVLGLISAHVGQLCIPSPVLGEVLHMTEDDCASLGLYVVEPTIDHLLSVPRAPGPLSFQDHLSLIVARTNGWCCLTNDGRLRKECKAQGVAVMWGLEPLGILVAAGVVSAQHARNVAVAVHHANSRFITREIVRRFLEGIGILEFGF